MAHVFTKELFAVGYIFSNKKFVLSIFLVPLSDIVVFGHFRKSELIEKKRLKKLRQRKDKLKDASDSGSKAALEMVGDMIVSSRVPSPTALSESSSSSLEEAAPLNKPVQPEPEVNHDHIENADLVCDGVYVEDFKISTEPENKQEHFCDKVDMENERGPVLSDSLEVLIGSISIAVEDTSLVSSGLTQLRSVDDKENSPPKDGRIEQMEHLTDGMQSESVASYGKSDDRLDTCREPFEAWRYMVPGPRLFSCKEASAFLAQSKSSCYLHCLQSYFISLSWNPDTPINLYCKLKHQAGCFSKNKNSNITL
jgi:hypothetical protein